MTIRTRTEKIEATLRQLLYQISIDGDIVRACTDADFALAEPEPEVALARESELSATAADCCPRCDSRNE